MSRTIATVFLALGLALTGCSTGGGGTSSSPPPQSSSDFSISFNPSSWTVQSGGELSVQATIAWTGTSNGSVSLSLGSPPTGISLSSSPVTIPEGGTSANLILTAATVTAGPSSIQLIAISSAGKTHSYTVPLVVTAAAVQPPAGRTSYILTGQTPESMVYDRAHKIIYAANSALNQVLLIDATRQAVIKTIPVGEPGGMDISPDGSQVVVGTDLLSSLTFISTSTQSVTRVVPFPPLANPNLPFLSMGGAVHTPVFLAGGDVLFINAGGVNIDEPKGLPYRWSSTTNVISPVPSGTVSGLNSGRDLHRTPDGSKVIIASTENYLFIYDAATNSITAQNTVFAAFVESDPANPRFAALDSNGFEILDTSLQPLATLPFSNSGASQPYGAKFSLDGTQLFVAQSGLFGGLYAYQTVDATHYTLGQQAPLMNLSGNDEQSNNVLSEVPLAITESNLIYGQGNRGIVIDDPLNYYTAPSPANGRGFESFTPNAGPLNTATQTKPYNSYSPTPGVYFSGIPALEVTDSNTLTITTPLISTPGPTNVNIVNADRSFSFYPAAFTFGIQATGLEPAAGPASGGITSDVLAFGVGAGFGNISVTVGGTAAKVLSVAVVGGLVQSPLPYYDVQFIVPPGAANSNVDVTVSGPSGTATLSKAFRYVSAITNYPPPGGDSLDRIVYDTHRKQLYIGAGNHIDVFSTASLSYLTPIVPPTLNGKLTLDGFDISPDGKWLVIANLTDQSIAIVNPDQPSNAKLIPFGHLDGTYVFGPFAVSATSKGTFFVGLGDSGISGAGNSLYELDPVSGSLQQRTDLTINLEVSGYRLLRSADASRVLIASPNGSGGPIALWTATTDTFTSLMTPGFVSDAAISGDGTTLGVPVTVETGGPTYQYVLDSNFNAIANVVAPEGLEGGALFGQFLNQSGSLLYIPVINGIDVEDVHTGFLRKRIGVNEAGNGIVYQAATTDDTGNYIFLLTLNGLDVIEDVPPLSVRSAFPLPNLANAGTVITLRGSNFQPGVVISIEGMSAPATIIDPQTLTFSLPGAVQGNNFVITNPTGETYTF
jgi:hypothetical protein